MDKLICNHCKNELTVDNIKDITFGRIYETTEFGIRDREVAFVWCSNCGESSITEEHVGYELELDLKKAKKYTFKEVEYLLKNLSNIDKEKVRNCKFRISESYPDDDSGDVYYYITIFKDDTEIGKITMYCDSNTVWDLETNEEIKYGEPSYSYTMELNKEQSSNEKDYIECPKCHNKILRKYWLNVKYQGHNNYGDYEEDIYTGECPICGEEIEGSNISNLYENESAEIELQQYHKIIGNFGYSSFPFGDCEYSETCAADELKYIKNALGNLTDILNVKYLYNIYNLQAIQSNKTYDYSSEVITNIVHNTSYADFNIDSIKDCQFRLLDCSALNDIVEDDIFDTPTITLLLQLIRNNKIIGYIEVSQQYPLDMKFSMFKVKKDSNKKLEELCKFYTNMYESIEDTPIMLSKSIKDCFNTPVCKKCGQLFCDCNLRCPICGKVFCEHKYKW